MALIEVRAAPLEHYGWLARKAGLVAGADFRALEAIEDGRILGMVGYDGWTPNSCSMHVAIDNPYAALRMIRPAFGLVFDQSPRGLGKGLVLASVLSTNKESLKFVQRLGFKQIAFIQDGWDKGVSIHVLQMRRENCRWLR